MEKEDGKCEGVSNVNHPKHYNFGKIEVIDAIEDWGCGFHDGNVVKYVARYKYKNGLEDLKKARWYLDRLIEIISNEEVRIIKYYCDALSVITEQASCNICGNHRIEK